MYIFSFLFRRFFLATLAAAAWGKPADLPESEADRLIVIIESSESSDRSYGYGGYHLPGPSQPSRVESGYVYSGAGYYSQSG